MSNTLIDIAKDVIGIEAQSLLDLQSRIDNSFVKACTIIKNCNGKVVVIGMGKSGLVGNKIAATFASTGTPSFAVHPSEAGHGDLGMISYGDVVVAISYSGESSEIITLMPVIQRLDVPIIAMTGNIKSSIGQACDVHLDTSVDKEACPHNLAPTSSTTTALALGDALAISLLTENGFSANDFARSHPSGALGRRLLTLVKNIMKSGDDVPIVGPETRIMDALIVMSEKALGMVLIEDKNKLLGIFTDGDLRRALETNSNISNLAMREVMTINCKSITADKPAVLAVKIMDENKLNSLPVVGEDGQVVGAINTHTLMQAKII
jgi:arabinose-5-phosphate isomerase